MPNNLTDRDLDYILNLNLRISRYDWSTCSMKSEFLGSPERTDRTEGRNRRRKNRNLKTN